MFLKLSAFEDRLAEWIRGHEEWRPNVRNSSLASLEAGLVDRPITRDIDWGVPVPVEGYEGKRIYVWFEACIGYLSASVEWAKNGGDEDAWRPFWQEDVPGYYFMGKDNIAFHSIIWPAMLLGYGGLNIPHNVVASEYLNIEGSKLSTSRNWAVWLPDLLERYDPDAIRYVLTAGGPETSRHRLQLGGVRAPQQRRTRSDVRQPRQPRARPHVPRVRRARAGAGRA